MLAPTGTPNDKTVFIHLNGFYAISGHDAPMREAVKRWNEFSGQPTNDAALDAATAEWKKKCGITDADEEEEKHAEKGGAHHHHHHHAACDVQKEVTAILVNMKGDSMTAAAMFSGEMKRGHKVQAVNPIIPMQRLMSDILGNVRTVLVVMTALIIVVSGVGIFVSIYNSMSDRRKEIAIMRALGAQRRTVFAIILAESILLCFGGGIFGILLGHGLVFGAAPIVQQQTGHPHQSLCVRADRTRPAPRAHWTGVHRRSRSGSRGLSHRCGPGIGRLITRPDPKKPLESRRGTPYLSGNSWPPAAAQGSSRAQDRLPVSGSPLPIQRGW